MEAFKCGHPKTKENSRSNGIGKSPRCATCKRSANSQYQKDHPDKVSARNRRVRGRYPEQERRRKIEWKRLHPEKVMQYSAHYRRKLGQSLWNSPECRAKMSASAKKRVERDGPFQVPSPSQLELNCIPLFAERGYRHTGDGSFWIRGKDGKNKNPDFKKTGSKAVIEVWGNYWHRNQDPQDLIDWYSENGYECEVYWESDLRAAVV